MDFNLFDSDDDTLALEKGYIPGGSLLHSKSYTVDRDLTTTINSLHRTDLIAIFQRAKLHRKRKGVVTPEGMVKVAAPMVRYSKLPFRMLLREYGNVDISFTPMILAQPFGASQIARDVEHTTHFGDTPLVMQFASNDAVELKRAVEHALPWVDGVDLNCGCPQRWAYKEGIGCRLLEQPELVKDMMSQVARLPRSHPVTTSIKIRLQKDETVKQTVEFIQRAHFLGLDFITIHGRNRHESSEKDRVDWDSLQSTCLSVAEQYSMPTIVNGDVFSMHDAQRAVTRTGADGVMAARGLLRNPTLFNPLYQPPLSHWEENSLPTNLDQGLPLGPVTPMVVVKRFMQLSQQLGLANQFITHHHLMYMLDGVLTRADKRTFNSLTSWAGIVDWMEESYFQI
jgi:tRNA-dihydrouridine synthase 4